MEHKHRKFSSGQVAIEQWLCELKAKDVPVLLCLTHADRLYAECINHDSTLEPTAYKQKTIDADLTVSFYQKLMVELPIVSRIRILCLDTGKEK